MKRIFDNQTDFNTWVNEQKMTKLKNPVRPNTPEDGDLFKNTEWAGRFTILKFGKVETEILKKHIPNNEIIHNLWN